MKNIEWKGLTIPDLDRLKLRGFYEDLSGNLCCSAGSYMVGINAIMNYDDDCPDDEWIEGIEVCAYWYDTDGTKVVESKSFDLYFEYYVIPREAIRYALELRVKYTNKG